MSNLAILNQEGRLIKGKVPRDYVFYSRSGYSRTMYKEWVPYLKEAEAYAEERNAHIIASIGAISLETWGTISKMAEDCGIKMLEAYYQMEEALAK